jgi:hypothetical protein
MKNVHCKPRSPSAAVADLILVTRFEDAARMNIKEIQRIGTELDAFFRARPFNNLKVSECLRRWDDAGLPRHSSEQVRHMMDDLLYGIWLIEAGRGGDNRSHDEVVADACRRIRFIVTEAYVLAPEPK